MTTATKPQPKKGARVMWVRCPHVDCRADVVISLDATTARCGKCGRTWPTSKSAQIRGTR